MQHRVNVITRLKAGFIALSACALVLGSVSALSIRSLKATVDAVTDRDARKVALAGNIQYSSADLLRLENGIIFRLMSQDAAGSENYRRLSKETQGQLSARFDELKPLVKEDQGGSSIEGMEATARAWAEGHEAMIAALDKQEYDTAQKVLSDRITPAGERLVSQASDYAKSVTAALLKARDEAGSREAACLWITSLVALLALGCAGGVYFVVNNASSTLRRVAAEVNGHAEQVASSAHQISEASQSVARSASNQAAALEETSASSQEITSITRRSADTTRVVANRMGETEKIAANVSQAMHEMMNSMREISQSSGKISHVIKVIDEIAFQTNILALNAAVEAARAGEAGMGFGVVADEVRSLAKRSAEAARETTALIEESISNSENGNAKAKTVASAVQSITENSAQMKSLIDEVNHSAQEQALGIGQIAEAILRMQSVTQETAAGAEESAAAGNEMTAQSLDMESTARGLLELVGGTLG